MKVFFFPVVPVGGVVPLLLFLAASVRVFAGFIEYPAEGNFKPEAGTMEIWFTAEGESEADPDRHSGRISFFQMDSPASHSFHVHTHAPAEGARPQLRASISSRTLQGGMLPLAGTEGSAVFEKGSRHHIALTWDGVHHALYLDGELVRERQQQAMFGEPASDEKIAIGNRFLKQNPIVVHAFRISAKAYEQSELQDSKPEANEDTLLLDRFLQVTQGISERESFSEPEVNSNSLGEPGQIRGAHRVLEAPDTGVALHQ